jgi:hypothetical protein
MMPQKLSSGLLVLATVHLPLSVYAPLSYSEVRAVRSPLGDSATRTLQPSARIPNGGSWACGDVLVALLGLLMQAPCAGMLAGHAD